MLLQWRAIRSAARSIRTAQQTSCSRVASTSVLSDWDSRRTNTTHKHHHGNSHQWNTHNLRSISILPTDDETNDTRTAYPRTVPADTSRITNLEDLYSLLLTRVPKGFENFLPKNARTGGSSNDSPDDKKSEDNNDKKSTKKSSSDNGGGDKKKREDDRRRKKEDEEMQQQLFGATLLLIIVMMARSLLEDDGMSGDGPEVTWHDFYNYMLTEGDVERIVVVNSKTARVYLRSGARGVPVGVSRGGMLRQKKEREDTTRISGSVGHDDSWDDGTIMEMNEGSSTEKESLGRGFPTVSLSVAPKQHQLVYHFNIGSVESFEDKLSRSQQELNISPRDYVPVQYATETNWIVELIKSAPALFLIGLTAYMLRGMGGVPGAGGGRGGGMGGLFSMGKSNAKLIKKEDVNVTFKDVAGCMEAKKEIMEFVDFLQDATQFTKLGAKIPKGAMLTGKLVGAYIFLIFNQNQTLNV